jgi:hypothetical protein
MAAAFAKSALLAPNSRAADTRASFDTQQLSGRRQPRLLQCFATQPRNQPGRCGHQHVPLFVCLAVCHTGVGLTGILYADREPFASWARHLASFGCQANAVAGSAYYKLLIGLLLGYKPENVLAYVAASGEQPSAELQKQVCLLVCLPHCSLQAVRTIIDMMCAASLFTQHAH